MSRTLTLRSDAETLQADLYGDLPARRAVILVHGQNWDASGWREIAPRFVARGVPALALNLRGYDGSTGKTNEWRPPAPWTPITDVGAAKRALREMGAAEIALVGASMGGHAVLGSSFEADVECVVSISAPVVTTPDELSRKITGRKLFVLADEDPGGVLALTLRTFAVASRPKTMLVFGGKEHSRGMFAAPYGEEALGAILDFVVRGL
ncbi:MAG TPA: alpha/beta fold hydrolase [Candidatus Limnocylindria bacterium]|nr:alpha/beta fold hydrolase [Candidatus Limnocylindria bacterium]